MSLPKPNLDDKTFEELVNEAKKLIPIYAPEWTDHNLHDPGITFIELFAWLTEMQLYSLNRITNQQLLKYLDLLGSRPLPATPAKVDVQFLSDDLKEITRFNTIATSSDVKFEINESVEILPLEIKKILSNSNDVTKFNEPKKTYYYAFKEHPNKGDVLYLGLDSKKDLAGKKVSLGIYLFEEDLPPLGQHGVEKLKVYPSAVVRWEYWNGDSWESLAVEALEETIITLTQSGKLSFIFPDDIRKGEPAGLTDKLFWIRCKIVQEGYEIPPRIDRILLNIITTTQGKTVKEEILESSSGLPFQVFNTKNFPVIAGSDKLIMPGDEEWLRVNDFYASKPEDRHYVINLVKGEIHFGNGVNGYIPSKGSEIKITYRYGGGVKGNVGAGHITEIDIPGVTVTNPFPAHSGREEESVEEAFVRFRQDLKIPFTAVTAADCEYVTINTPGLRVAGARAIVSSENAVNVVVIPYSLLEKPTPSEGFKKTVYEHLNTHRLITANIKVSEPEYVRVSIDTEIRMKPGYSPELVRDRVKNALNKFLSPIKRKPDENAWQIGRAVYRSEVYEVIEDVDGVDYVQELSLKGDEGMFRYKNGDIKIGALSLVYPGKHNIEVLGPQTIHKRGVYENE